MSVTVEWVEKQMEELAPPSLAMDWDNVGLMVARENRMVNKILVALDLTDAVLAEALKLKAEMVVTHHPVIFGGINSVTYKTALGRRLIKLIENNIAVYSAHTNLDIAQGGTNDALFEVMELKNMEELGEKSGIGKTGFLRSPVTLEELCTELKKRLGLKWINYAGDPARVLKKVGLCSGSGAGRSFLSAAAESGCDVYVTGDVKYHDAQEAADLGLCIIDATHYASEVIIVEKLCHYLKESALRDGKEILVEASKVDGSCIYRF